MLQSLHICTECAITGPWPSSSGASPAPPRITGSAPARLVVVALASLALLSLPSAAASPTASHTPGTESQQAYDLLAERFPARAGDTATSRLLGPGRDAARAPSAPRRSPMRSREIAGQPHVTAAANPLETRGPGLARRTGRVRQVQYDRPPPSSSKPTGERLADAAQVAERAASRRANGQWSTRPNSRRRPSAS